MVVSWYRVGRLKDLFSYVSHYDCKCGRVELARTNKAHTNTVMWRIVGSLEQYSVVVEQVAVAVHLSDTVAQS